MCTNTSLNVSEAAYNIPNLNMNFTNLNNLVTKFRYSNDLIYQKEKELGKIKDSLAEIEKTI